MLVEICVQGIEAVAAAAEGGAHRIELCEALHVGGVTPSHGMIAEAVAIFPNPVHVMIRPRGGDFVATPRELKVMVRDVEAARKLGARGVVFGLLDRGGQVDREALAVLMAAAGPMEATFHRAIDQVADVSSAVDAVIELGFRRVLSSGGAPSAREGVRRLRSMQAHADGRLVVIAGGRCQLQDMVSFVAARIEEVHFASAAQVDGKTNAHRVRQLVDEAGGITRLD